MASDFFAAIREKHRVDGVPEYSRGSVFDPGALSAVYHPDFADPMCSMVGAATAVGNPPSPFQPPPLYIPSPARIVVGMPTELGQTDTYGLDGAIG